MGRTGIVNGVGAVFMDRRLLPKPARAGGYHSVAILRKNCRHWSWPTPLAGAVLAVGLLTVACGASSERPVSTRSPPTFGAWEYEVRPTPALSELQVRVCFDGRPPSSLIATKRAAAGAVVRAWRSAGPRQPLAARGRVLSLASVGPNECVAYVVDIDRAIGSSWSGGFARSGAVVLDAATWLWRPSSWPNGSTATVRFVLPEGQQLATSWSEVGPLTFRFPPEAFGYLSHIAIGRFSESTVELPTAEVRLVRLPGRLDLSDEQLGEWVEYAAGLVTRLSGRFPVSNPLVLLVPVPPGRSPVAFGAVGRGGGASVLFLVRENATLEALNSDWVAPHEFSHLAFPFVRRSERFFSEGLATYFQEVLRAWGGVLTELEGWQHLNAGFAPECDPEQGARFVKRVVRSFVRTRFAESIGAARPSRFGSTSNCASAEAAWLARWRLFRRPRESDRGRPRYSPSVSMRSSGNPCFDPFSIDISIRPSFPTSNLRTRFSEWYAMPRESRPARR